MRKFNQFINEEASIRFPNSLEYWRTKGKIGKQCIIYTHDDLDGIMSAIAMKEYLLQHGFTIVGYAVINYTDGWKVFTLDKQYINIAVDFAEDNKDLDLFIDHHMEEGDGYKKCPQSIKMKSDSCYGLVCRLLGMPTDKLILSVISMIDAAKYEEYGVDVKTILDFDLNEIVKSKNARLQFSGAFNQLIKRSDYKTIIEVVHNGTPSIFKIFKLFKIFYPLNNLKVKRGTDKEEARNLLLQGTDQDDVEGLTGIPEFVPDSVDRMGKMIARTAGNYEKPFINSLDEFKDFYWNDNEMKFKFDGFLVFKNLVYVPVGTWANALRARALIEEVLGRHDKNIQFILLDYGASLQIASYKGIDKTPNLPKLRGGEILDDLDKYTRFLGYFVLPKLFDFKYGGLKCGGHPGIGNISQCLGTCQTPPFNGMKYMDIMKNWIIHDITGIPWKLTLKWNENPAEVRELPDKVLNLKLMTVDKIRKVNV
jgi:hypothetical protein